MNRKWLGWHDETIIYLATDGNRPRGEMWALSLHQYWGCPVVSVGRDVRGRGYVCPLLLLSSPYARLWFFPLQRDGNGGGYFWTSSYPFGEKWFINFLSDDSVSIKQNYVFHWNLNKLMENRAYGSCLSKWEVRSSGMPAKVSILEAA